MKNNWEVERIPLASQPDALGYEILFIDTAVGLMACDIIYSLEMLLTPGAYREVQA